MIWAALALKQKGTRAHPWEAPPKQHVGVASLLTAGGAGWEHLQKCNSVHRLCGASRYFLCKQCPLTAEAQVCKCSSPNTWILAICVFLTRCCLAVFNSPFFPPGSVPTVCFSLSCSLQCPPWACTSLLPVCQTALLQATKPCNIALCTLERASPLWQDRLSSAAFPGTSSVQWEGLMQKAALTRKSCPCQSVCIREPLLSSALRHASAGVNN